MQILVKKYYILNSNKKLAINGIIIGTNDSCIIKITYFQTM